MVDKHLFRITVVIQINGYSIYIDNICYQIKELKHLFRITEVIQINGYSIYKNIGFECG